MVLVRSFEVILGFPSNEFVVKRRTFIVLQQTPQPQYPGIFSMNQSLNWAEFDSISEVHFPFESQPPGCGVAVDCVS